MRATVEQIKAAILYPDVEVRESAVCFLRRSCLVDTTIMPLVIQAYLQYGRDAFSIPNVWPELLQTAETLDWVIEQLQGLDPSTNEIEERFTDALVEALYRTEASVLAPRLATIKAIAILDDEAKEIIEDRVFLSTFPCERLWGELLAFCEAREDAEEIIEKDVEFGHAMVDNLSRFPAEVTPRVLTILKDEHGSHGYFLDEWAIELAGRLRLEEAVPLLINRLADPDTFSNEAVHRALEHIGTDAVVTEIEKCYADGDWDFRTATATTLEDVHSDLSVRISLELYRQEEDEDIKGFLLQAALMNFATEAIEPARQFVLSQPKSPEQLEVRTALLTACKLMGESFPEFEEWLEDSKSDTEFRRQWYKDHPPNWAAFEDDEEFEDEELENEEFDQPSVTIIRLGGEPVGRNDPCPCGSGKKYKKCCARREEVAEESDEEHATVMGSFQRGGAAKFPIGTFANYGPDDKTTTKIVVGIIKHEGAEPILERWVGTKITQNPKVQRQVKEFLERHKVTSVVISQGNLGCPHEEGLDFPHGGDCPFCPFWAGKQGSNGRE